MNRSNKYIIILVLLFSHLLSVGQINQFDDFVEFQPKNKAKIYLDAVFRLAFKECADYYLIGQLHEKYFYFIDTVSIYRLNGQLFQSIKYHQGLKEGEFLSYHESGQIEIRGNYKEGMRHGLWKYYHDNGQLKKTVEYKDNREFLWEFYNKKGKTLIENGEGKYQDESYYSIANDLLTTTKGEVKNGLPDGKWIISLGNSKIGTEYFENNRLLKGISHSNEIGDQEYYDNYYVTFSGINFIEHLKIISPSACSQQSGLYLGNGFFRKLESRIEISEVPQKVGNGWLWVQVKSKLDTKPEEVKIISNLDQEIEEHITEILLNLNNSMDGQPAKVGIFPIVIKNSKVHLPYSEEIELLRYRY